MLEKKNVYGYGVRNKVVCVCLVIQLWNMFCQYLIDQLVEKLEGYRNDSRNDISILRVVLFDNGFDRYSCQRYSGNQIWYYLDGFFQLQQIWIVRDGKSLFNFVV